MTAIVFHDGLSFNEAFVQKYTHAPFITFVKIDPPQFDSNTPIITPNDFRYIVFDQYLQELKEKIPSMIGTWWQIWMSFSTENHSKKCKTILLLIIFTFFGSWDGGVWQDGGDKKRFQRTLFERFYGQSLIDTFREGVEWENPNGNCGLWADKPTEFDCVMSCMADQYSRPPVLGKGNTTL